MSTFTEENYLKAIYKLGHRGEDWVSTNSLAEILNTKASSVTDMVKKLAEKDFVNYKPYTGVNLTAKGLEIAVGTIRKHRLWEVFLVERLDFKWDEVHEIAEELEHINSDELVLRLEKFLGYPKYDPHGDPIPDRNGKVLHHKNRVLSDLKINEEAIIVGVKEHAPSFLQYLEKHNLLLGTRIKVRNKFEFDHSLVVEVKGIENTVSHQVAKNLYVVNE
ncbi:MAG: metal-dependent transcriptional regulator [Bacteroidia bacterium]|nr:metal-dependent transcriptional regulator [Bacteroidia bacterium]